MRRTTRADARLRRAARRRPSDDARHAEALALLREHAALRQARAEVWTRADEARKLLAALPASAARQALAALCDMVVTRTA